MFLTIGKTYGPKRVMVRGEYSTVSESDGFSEGRE